MDETSADLGSHADQCVLGSKTLAINNFEKPANVVGCNPRGPMMTSLCVISRALACNCPDADATFILIAHQATHNPKLDHNLLTPLQLGLNDVIVNDVPKLMTEAPAEMGHMIAISDPEMGEQLTTPLMTRGVTSTLPTWKPMLDERNACPRLTLTYDSPEHEPLEGQRTAME